MSEQKYPLISVVIPVYNGERSISRAIKSVLNQSYPNIELIVVDDASKDDTLEVVKGFNGNKIKIIKHSKNKNGSAARNTGIKAAKGEYIALLDDDDEWLPDKLTAQYRYLKDKDPKKWKMVLSSYYFLNENNWSVVEFLKEGDLFEEVIMLKLPIVTSTFFVHKSVFKTVGYFNEKYEKFQSVEFMLRYLRKYQIAIVRKPLARVYGEQGLTRAEKVLNNKLLFLEDFEGDIKKLSPKLQKKVYARHWLHVARFFALDGRPKTSFYYLLKSLSYSFLFSFKVKFMPFGTYFAIPLYLIRAWYLRGQRR